MAYRPLNGQALLRRQIQELRVFTDDVHRSFIPNKSLFNLLTEERIRAAVASSNKVLPYEVEELVKSILRGARKIFAILVLLKGEEGHISHFVRSDGFRKIALDHKLPFSEDALNQILPPDAAHDFYHIQWELIAPVFSKGVVPRVLESQICLPFLHHRDTGKEGGFGHVFEFEIHPEHHRFSKIPNKTPRFVRKEFLPNTSDHGQFEVELHNLNLLSNLEHPNIIELLASWTYRGKHNALFYYAEDGDLSSLLESPSRPSHFLKDQDFYKAMSELASAVQAVHKYASEKLNLSLIGVHHDLRPQNILVHGGSFILADFGLSKFKKVEEDSKSLFKIGGGYYLAPECEDYEDGCQRHTISRPSGIWSLGCILAEILTYMVYGADGIAEFEREREITIGYVTTKTFHGGRNKPNIKVISWLEKLWNEVAMPGQTLLALIKSMLSMDPESRPTAKEASSHLDHTAVEAYLQLINHQFGLIQGQSAVIKLRIEEQRTNSWCWAVRSYHSATDPWHQEIYSLMDIKAALKILIDMSGELTSISLSFSDGMSPHFRRLQDFNEQLLNCLSQDGRERAKTDFELQMLRGVVGDNLPISGTSTGSSLDNRIGMLALMKRMNHVVSDHTMIRHPHLRLKRQQIKVLEAFEDHNLGILYSSSEEDGSRRRVLIEWVAYDTHWAGRVSEEMYARMEAIAELPRKPAMPDTFRVLNCEGVFHDSTEFRFGFVYAFPDDAVGDDSQAQLRSLSHVIQETRDSRHRPSLNDRFDLAEIAASMLLDFHKVNWVHKSISAHNIVFFTSPKQPPRFWLQNAHIIGFNRSRPDDPQSFTNGPTLAFKSHAYQHPLYQKDRSRFQSEFDYYSLGLVLLEIGLWQTLEEMSTKLVGGPISNEETIEKLLVKRVPLLNHAMGNDYSEAVQSCLRWVQSHKDNTDDRQEYDNDHEDKKVISLREFEQKVVERIVRRLS